MMISPKVSTAGTDRLSDTAYQLLHDALIRELHQQQDHWAELQSIADELSGHTDSDSVLAREIADRGCHRAQEALAEIEHARARIAAGTYGSCERCERPIPFERLEAIPQARHCVTCPAPEPLVGS
jgi:RNA polymerase-binding transcription factor DksA